MRGRERLVSKDDKGVINLCNVDSWEVEDDEVVADWSDFINTMCTYIHSEINLTINSHQYRVKGNNRGPPRLSTPQS